MVENLNKITFFGVYSNMAKKRPLLIFLDSFLNFCKANKNFDYSANFQNFCNFCLLMGPHYVDFTFASETTLIWLEMTEIWPKYVSSAQDPPWIVLTWRCCQLSCAKVMTNLTKLQVKLVLGLCHISAQSFTPTSTTPVTNG